jgi:hypothetical protein
MLSAQQLLATSSKRRPIRSLREQYNVYIMDRVEHYKNSISRQELLRQAEEALVDLRHDEQFPLTEMLMETVVDEFIKKRLGIKGFESWRKSYPKLRAAQRDPTHWGLDASHLVATLAPRVEPGDAILVIGGGAEASAYLLAAHDALVTFIDHDLGLVERAEHRIALESLSSSFEALCMQFGIWLPSVGNAFQLVVLDAGTLASLNPGERRVLLGELQRITVPGGLHAVVADAMGGGAEGLAGHYAQWRREPLPHAGRQRRGTPSRGALFSCPPPAEPSRQQGVRA